MARGGAARTGAEVLPREVDYTYTAEKMLVPMLYPLIVAMSLFGRTGNVFWPFNPPVDVGPVVEQPLVVLLRTCLTFFAIVLIHMLHVHGGGLAPPWRLGLRQAEAPGRGGGVLVHLHGLLLPLRQPPWYHRRPSGREDCRTGQLFNPAHLHHHPSRSSVNG